LTAEQQELRAQMVRQILADIKRDFPSLCSHCGRRIESEGASSNYVNDTACLPCSPPYMNTCGQPFSSPDRDCRKRHLPPAMLPVCAGWWRFYRELHDGREVYRCRHCGDVLVLTPVFSKAGVAWLRDRWGTTAPGTKDFAYAAERHGMVSRFMGSHVSMYAGKRSRRPAKWTLRADQVALLRTSETTGDETP
jgi:hypothetical protein